MPPGTFSLRSMLRLLQCGALFAAITVLLGVLVAQVSEGLRTRAEQGDASAQLNLALRYRYGLGVPQDYAEAVKWHRLAAEQGGASAQSSLALMYDKGEGVPQDDAEAVK